VGLLDSEAGTSVETHATPYERTKMPRKCHAVTNYQGTGAECPRNTGTFDNDQIGRKLRVASHADEIFVGLK